MCHLDLEAAKTITEEGARISSEDSNLIRASNSHVCCQKQKMANRQLNSARAQKETHLPPLPCPRPRMNQKHVLSGCAKTAPRTGSQKTNAGCPVGPSSSCCGESCAATFRGNIEALDRIGCGNAGRSGPSVMPRGTAADCSPLSPARCRIHAPQWKMPAE